MKLECSMPSLCRFARNVAWRRVANLALAATLFAGYAPVQGASLVDEGEPQLKMDTPHFDNTIIPRKTLKGGVQHSEKRPKKAATLSSSAHKNTADIDIGKLKQRTAKAQVTSPLKSKITELKSNLQDTVESGIGIIGVKFMLGINRPPVINRVFAGTPASDLGLRVNDIIVAVDGIPTFGLTKEEVYNMIVGTPGTSVTISVSRHGDFLARTMNRMDFNDIKDPRVRHDYLTSL